ncbi:OmpA family protein [Microlunatus sp. GCM10028923]|uniref:OmpA family protein n=1 Tax=Microlunatus sp. GCM10028923 TaxID=3273400 RepID=UPI0036075437
MKLRKALVAGAIVLLPLSMAATCAPPKPAPLVTVALTATSAEPLPSVAVLHDQLVAYALAARHPGEATVRVVTAKSTITIDLTPMRGTAIERIPDRAATKIEENLTELETTVAGITATEPGLDTIAVLDRAISETPRGGQLYLLSSGYSSVPPADLRKAGGWIANPKGFIQRTRTADLPHADGRHLTYVGLGYAAGRQPSAGPAARTALTTIYLGLCKKAGAASCKSIDRPVSEETPKATAPVPLISLTEIPTACVASRITIDATVAFRFDSWHFTKSATKILRPIAELLQQCPAGKKVTITGYSARTPTSTGPATDLELKRARAVRNRLHDLGVPDRVLGPAKAGGQLVNNMPHGQYSAQMARANRVVVLTIQ